MPLDSGGVTQLYRTGEHDPADPFTPTEEPSLHYGPDIGAALKAAREFRGLSLQDVADQTRIRRTYLSALEDMRIEELPSRPFTIGYIKAYAALMGMDADEAVARFKDTAPDPDEPLRAPVGVRRERDPRMGAIMAAGAFILAAIVLWNIAQRAITEEKPAPEAAPPAAMSSTVADTGDPTGPTSIGAPLPAPTEASTPPVYQTPGLEDAAAAGGSADAVTAAAKARKAAEAAAAVQPSAPIGTPFAAKGKIYGVPAAASTVTLQARRQTFVTVSGADGAIYFGGPLAPGEAFRLPNIKGVTVEVTDPTSVDVFVAGALRSVMPAPKATVSALGG